MRTTKKINKNWREYDKVVAQCQLWTYGVIFLDKYGCPIDNEYEQDELYEEYKKRGRSEKQ